MIDCSFFGVIQLVFVLSFDSKYFCFLIFSFFFAVLFDFIENMHILKCLTCHTWHTFSLSLTDFNSSMLMMPSMVAWPRDRVVVGGEGGGGDKGAGDTRAKEGRHGRLSLAVLLKQAHPRWRRGESPSLA